MINLYAKNIERKKTMNMKRTSNKMHAWYYAQERCVHVVTPRFTMDV